MLKVYLVYSSVQYVLGILFSAFYSGGYLDGGWLAFVLGFLVVNFAACSWPFPFGFKWVGERFSNTNVTGVLLASAVNSVVVALIAASLFASGLLAVAGGLYLLGPLLCVVVCSLLARRREGGEGK